MSPLVWVARIGTDGPPQGDDPSVPAVVRLMRNRCEAEPAVAHSPGSGTVRPSYRMTMSNPILAIRATTSSRDLGSMGM